MLTLTATTAEVAPLELGWGAICMRLLCALLVGLVIGEERQYYETIGVLRDAIGNSTSPTVDEYIAAVEAEICAELVYVAWLGFQQNIDFFNNPVNTMFLKMDYEDFHRERRMGTLPQVQHASKTINAFHDVLRSLPEEKRNLTEGITSYISYLETAGYKLAHYFGFIFADQFLEHVIPGYPDLSRTESTAQ